MTSLAEKFVTYVLRTFAKFKKIENILKFEKKQESHKMRLNIPLHLIAIYLLFKNFHKIII